MEKSPDWTEAWSGVSSFLPLGENNMFTGFLDLYVPQRDNSDLLAAIEIGCFPGRFIDYICSKNYQANGIDTFPNTPIISKWLEQRERHVGSFQAIALDSFVESNPGKTFDIVASFGFIEHFANFCEILFYHAKLCKVGGRIIIGAPNFASPLQRALHKVLDYGNLEDHVLSSMYPQVWAIFLSALGFNIIRSGAMGRFGFWSAPVDLEPMQRLLLSKLAPMAPHIEQFSDSFNRRETSYVIIVADKIRDGGESFNSWKCLGEHCLSVAKELSAHDDEASSKFVSLMKYICE